MSMNYTEHELRKLGDSDLAKVISGVHDAFKKRHPDVQDILLPKSVPTISKRETSQKVYPEISLDEELQRQRTLIFEKVANPLGMSEADCFRALPSSFPERTLGQIELGLDIPILVPKFPQFSWLQVIDAANLGISDYLKGRLNEMKEWEDPRGIEISDGLYGAWVHIGDRYKFRKPADVRGELKNGERGGTHWDGVGLAIVRRDIIMDENKYFDLIGSVVGSGRVPFVDGWFGRPEFSAPWETEAHPGFQALVCGS